MNINCNPHLVCVKLPGIHDTDRRSYRLSGFDGRRRQRESRIGEGGVGKTVAERIERITDVVTVRMTDHVVVGY